MNDLTLLENCYKKYINNLAKWAPEGIISIDLNLLHKLNLLHCLEKEIKLDPSITRYFHVVESEEKIMLLNEEFVIWIVPENVEGTPTTFALVALNGSTSPHLELVFKATGVYNTSKLVLQVLDKFLLDIQENEALLKQFNQ